MFRLGRIILWSLALALLAGCGGSASDKAGGQRLSSIVLTLADGETDFSNAQPFADAVKRLSHGRLVIRIVSAWRASDPRYETALIRDVKAGSVQLGISASRAFDTVGIDSFQVLQAPFLIDSVALERKVLASNIPEKMLEGLGQTGLVGLAILPGPLRRPLGITKPLLSVADYQGARIGIRASTVTEETLKALGADAVVLPVNRASGLDGAEEHLWAIDAGFAEQGSTVTGNVDFEPRPNVIFVNRRAFESLTAADRDILVHAAAQARISGGVYEPDGPSVQDVCRRGVKIVAASSRDVAGLHSAVQPVYRTLEASPSTRAFIKQIAAMRGAAEDSPDAVSCPVTRGSSGVAFTRELQGKWEVTYTLNQLNAAGADPSEDLPANYGHQTLTFDGRNFSDAGPDVGPGAGAASGIYVVKGPEITFYRSDHSYPGSNTEIWGPFTWSVYRDTLTFKKNGPGPMPTSLVVKAWRRSANSG
jgi:TRAP-type C4-dicarboxylate transport system substrate-binding protein